MPRINVTFKCEKTGEEVNAVAVCETPYLVRLEREDGELIRGFSDFNWSGMPADQIVHLILWQMGVLDTPRPADAIF